MTLKAMFHLTPKAMFHPQLYMKYQIENWRCIVFFSQVLFTLGWQSSRDGVSIKIQVPITSLGWHQEGHPAKKKSATLFMKCLLKLI